MTRVTYSFFFFLFFFSSHIIYGFLIQCLLFPALRGGGGGGGSGLSWTTHLIVANNYSFWLKLIEILVKIRIKSFLLFMSSFGLCKLECVEFCKDTKCDDTSNQFSFWENLFLSLFFFNKKFHLYFVHVRKLGNFSYFCIAYPKLIKLTSLSGPARLDFEWVNPLPFCILH